MTGETHLRHDLAAFVLGALDAPDTAAVEGHLDSCAECRHELHDLRAMTDLLGDIPPEILLDGPPDGGELVVQRAIDQMRAGRDTAARRRRRGSVFVAAAVACVLVGAGAVAGHELSGTGSPAPITSRSIAGARLASATDGRTGARLVAQVVPAAGWVRVFADVRGIAAGQRCRLVVVDRAGHTYVAGSWLVSAKGAAGATKLDGSALVDPAEVTAVAVESDAGRLFVSANVR